MSPAKQPAKRPARRSRAVYTALGATLKELDLGPEDKAGEALARRLATAIDQETSGRTVAELGRAMLAVLESLGATPAARKALMKGVQQPNERPDDTSGVDELRKRRDSRADRAASVDSSAP